MGTRHLRVGVVMSLGALALVAPLRAAAAITGWSSRALAVTATGAVDESLYGLSCVGADCVAVGTENQPGQRALTAPTGEAIVATIHAATWGAVTALATPAGYQDAVLNNVTCLTASECVAVGDVSDANGVRTPLLETYNGTSWTATVVTADANGAFNAISCADDTCAAVGVAGTGDDATPLVVTGGPVDWSTATTVTPTADVTGSLAGVSCVDASDCVAVGTSGTEPVIDILAPVTDDTSAWTASDVPTPEGWGSTTLNDVSCWAADECWASGQGGPPGSTSSPLYVELNGLNEHFFQGSPPAGDTGLEIWNLTCTSSTACVGTSIGTASGAATASYYTLFNGSQLTVTPWTQGAGQNGDRATLACESATVCVAMVDTQNASGVHTPIGHVLASGAWSTRDLGGAGPVTASLSSVACATTVSCVAVGQVDAVGGVAQLLVEHDTGATWSQQSAVVVGAVSSSLGAVACPSVSDCLAVGEVTKSTGVEPIALTITAHGASAVALGAVKANEVVDMTGISCWSTKNCVAVGYWLEGVDPATCTVADCVTGAYVATLVGTKWSTRAFAPPSNMTQYLPNAISCWAANHCVVAGYGETESGYVVVASTEWDNSWRSVPVRAVTGGVTSTSDPLDVSCASATVCTMVGASAVGGTTRAVAWTGHYLGPFVPHVSNLATPSFLSGVSCATSGKCEAVGERVTYPGIVGVFQSYDATTSGTAVAFGAPAPATPAGLLDLTPASVSCPSTTTCVAVGAADDTVVTYPWVGRT